LRGSSADDQRKYATLASITEVNICLKTEKELKPVPKLAGIPASPSSDMVLGREETSRQIILQMSEKNPV